MGKFSADFERVDKDFYRTWDPRAGEALQPHIIGINTYAEPCVGLGDLVLQLDKQGKECLLLSDLEIREGAMPQTQELDALELREEHLLNCDAIITNPPWDRPILHKMIEHFANLRPTYLLFEADWAHTKQAIPYLEKYCTDIISIGRMKWIIGTNVSGTKDMAWYRFSVDKGLDPILFHPRKL